MNRFSFRACTAPLIGLEIPKNAKIVFGILLADDMVDYPCFDKARKSQSNGEGENTEKHAHEATNDPCRPVGGNIRRYQQPAPGQKTCLMATRWRVKQVKGEGLGKENCHEEVGRAWNHA